MVASLYSRHPVVTTPVGALIEPRGPGTRRLNRKAASYCTSSCPTCAVTCSLAIQISGRVALIFIRAAIGVGSAPFVCHETC